MSPIVRVIDAAIDETIEIHWWRKKDPDPGTEILRIRYTAPPAAVWAARISEQQDQEHPSDE